MKNAWEFEEALECFKVIETCLKCIYAGEKHMCRALSVQLRILLCDNNPKPLLLRLMSNLELSEFISTDVYNLGEFPNELDHLNSIKSINGNVSIICMPFEFRRYFDGTEDCVPLIGKRLLTLEKWMNQKIISHPVPMTVTKLIKVISNKGGGAHVDRKQDKLLTTMREMKYWELNICELLIIGLAKIVQQISFQLIQMYEQKIFKLPLNNFNPVHSSILNAAKVNDECLKKEYQAANLILAI